MSNLSKADLGDIIAESAGISKAAGERAINDVFGAITEALANGGSVSCVGFGSFSVGERAAREGRNPQTGVTIQIAACKTVKFKAGKAFKDAVNK